MLCGIIIFGCQASYSCELNKPIVPPPDTPEMANRLKTYENSGTILEKFLRASFSLGVDRNIQTELNGKSKGLSKTLLWTGDQGALLDVVLIEPALSDSQPPSLLYVEVVGTGSCPMDVLVQDVDKEHLKIAPPDKFKISDSASFYLWAQRKKDGSIIYKVEFPGSRRPLQQAALAAASTKEALLLTQQIRETDRILHVAEMAKSGAATAELRTAIAQAAATIRNTETRRLEVDSNYQAALDRDKTATGALQWLDTLGKIVSTAQLANQVNGLLGSSAPSDVKKNIDAAGSAGDFPKVKSTLVDWQIATQAESKKIDAERSVITKTYMEKKTFIQSEATKQGAPEEVFRFP